MNIKKENVIDQWTLFTMENDNRMKVSVLDFGGIITSIMVPDKTGKFENVVLGYKNLKDYNENPNFFGAIIGPVAGRIQGAAFRLEGKEYVLNANEGVNHLHGADAGFHQVIWHAEPFQHETGVGVKLTHSSTAGEGGYPGNVEIAVTYTLTNDNQLILEYAGTTDETTALTLTNHSYFNLSGNLKETIHNHQVTIDSHQFIELDENLIPTGALVDVTDTPFDFRNGRKLSDGIMSDSVQNKLAGNGYDHYFIFDRSCYESVMVKDEASGRVMAIKTDQPGMVMYTANSLEKGINLREGESAQHLGVCFETQASPASLHHDGFPSVVLKAGETYSKRTVFSFGVEE